MVEASGQYNNRIMNDKKHIKNIKYFFLNVYDKKKFEQDIFTEKQVFKRKLTHEL